MTLQERVAKFLSDIWGVRPDKQEQLAIEALRRAMEDAPRG